ncbi:ADP-heptose--LPS heptosyltransferase 2 [bacterium HR36]|nr:ADP-heptose--LPS heptosyltransferase 2 [bacterium HR36]
MTTISEASRIAVFVPNWVGDAVMCTPALRALRQRFPQAEIVGVLRSYLTPLFAGGSWFDALISSDSFFPAIRQLRQSRVEIAILFPNSLRVALLAKLGSCRFLVGYRRDGRGWLLTHALDWPAAQHGKRAPYPMILAYNRLVMELGGEDPGVQMTLVTTPAQEAEAEAVWQRYGWHGQKVVGLHGGAAYGSAKCWPFAYCVELARLLADRGYAVLVLCGPKECAFAAAIEQQVCHPAVRSLHREKLHLGLMMACLRRVRLLITTDSGPRHIAAAFDRPVLTLFGPTDIAWTETFHAKSLHLQIPVPCGPCQLRRCPLDHRCMRQLTPDFVFAQACNWLARWEKCECDPLPNKIICPDNAAV